MELLFTLPELSDIHFIDPEEKELIAEFLTLRCTDAWIKTFRGRLHITWSASV